MFARITRRALLRGALATVAAAACILPVNTPASAARGGGLNPNSPKGTFSGPYSSVMTQGKTGTLIVKISQDKNVKGTTELRKLSGNLTLDATVKNKKALGGFGVSERVVSLGTPVKKGYALTVLAVLSEDGMTLENGIYFLVNVGTGMTEDQGEFTLTRQ